MAEEMGRASSSGRDHVEYGWEVRSVEVDEAPGAAADPDAHCVAVTARSSGEDGGVVKRHFRAKYVLGCDGAHSLVRKALGIEMVGDSTDAVWGVMDVYPRTDFPDIRKKVVINSEAGNLLIIPREGGSMVRFYTELQGAVARDVTLAALQEKARLVFRPYTVDFAETAWWSAYAIGQRLASAFDRAGRVFLAGDACHTHSPKAGQGMNVSLMDGYNLGWKLAAVLQQGRGPAIVADPAALLATYVAERRRTAAELIDFDRYWTRLFNSAFRRANDITPERFRDAFVRAGRYTAGQAIRYENSVLTAAAPGDAALAAGVTVGMRFPSAQVVRLCDARTLQLATALPADARWHIVVFGGDVLESSELRRLHEMSTVLVNIIREFTPPDFEPDSVINPILVLSSKRLGIQQALIPELFTPVTGKWKTKDLFKVFVDDEGYNRSGHGHAYEAYGIDPHQGALVVVRPDQHVAKICSLADVDEVCGFFGGFLRKSSRGDSNNP
ncbi:FAD binding domain-containing protein [Xylariaceae sp. FL0804]|nr:FAD binding domain-containing protein [Xylariaceae sp. FL0804]